MIGIKEIAKLSGVSPSTVSKIINNKADNISQEVKDKVLAIVKQYNYTPYGLPAKNNKSKSFTIALLTSDINDCSAFTTGLMHSFTQRGYSLMIYDSQKSLETERVNLAKIATKNLDGLIWDPCSPESISNYDLVRRLGVETIGVNTQIADINTRTINYEMLGYRATECLIGKGHSRIMCVTGDDSLRAVEVTRGYKKCLYDNSIPFDDELLMRESGLDYTSVVSKGTAILSSHYNTAENIYTNLSSLMIDIPNDISILAIRNYERRNLGQSNVSAIDIPNYEFGDYIGGCIVDLCEKNEPSLPEFVYEPFVDSMKTVDVPSEAKNPKIMVVGSLNIDNILYLDDFAVSGKTQFASESVTLPGGKGLNQSIGVSMHKKEVQLIGRIGKDMEASVILKKLKDSNVNTNLIISDNARPTGKAFIVINREGDSTITVSAGANNDLSAKDIQKQKKSFKNTSLCLIQTEIPICAVNEAAALAKKNRAVTILKPAAISSLEGINCSNIDILVPNRNEALTLSGKETLEEAGAYFRNLGIGTVIITVDKDGAMLFDSIGVHTFDAPAVNAIDTTGASDAFISTLAVKLADGYDMPSSITCAQIAAGFCISRFGVSNSMIDKETLDRYIIQKRIELKKA